jgi:hypothetical protein
MLILGRDGNTSAHRLPRCMRGRAHLGDHEIGPLRGLGEPLDGRDQLVRAEQVEHLGRALDLPATGLYRR